jgi:hypothetical protein
MSRAASSPPLEKGTALDALGITTMQTSCGALGQQLRQSGREEVESLGAGNGIGAIVDGQRRIVRIEKMEEIGKGYLRTDDKASCRQDDGANVTGRRQTIATTAMRWDDINMRTVIREEEIDIGAGQATFTRDALTE